MNDYLQTSHSMAKNLLCVCQKWMNQQQTKGGQQTKNRIVDNQTKKDKKEGKKVADKKEGCGCNQERTRSEELRSLAKPLNCPRKSQNWPCIY